MNIAILANGQFPAAPQPLSLLLSADHIVCCDAAYDNLLAALPDIPTPLTVIGDLDSINSTPHNLTSIRISDQNTNDLTKAVQYTLSNLHPTSITILGATGLREDHTLGNISLLADYQQLCQQLPVPITPVICTDTGLFTPISSPTTFRSFPRQQVSIFALDPTILITTTGLQYPLSGQPLPSLWQGTLNSSLSDQFAITPSHGTLLIYQTHLPKS